jgi:hypothetical protein
MIGVLGADGVTISLMEPKSQGRMDRNFIKATITFINGNFINGNGLDYFWLSKDANLQTVPTNIGSHAGASSFALGSSTTSCMSMQGKIFSATNSTMQTGYVTTGGLSFAVSERTFSARLAIVSQTGCTLYAVLFNSGDLFSSVDLSHAQHLIGVLETDGVTISFTEPKDQGHMDRNLIKATIRNSGSDLEFLWLSQDANLQTYSGTVHANAYGTLNAANSSIFYLSAETSMTSSATSCASMQGKTFSAFGSSMQTGYVTTGGDSDITARTFSAALTIVSQTGCILYAILSNSGVPHTQHLIGVLEADGVTISFTEPKNQGRMDRDLIKATITNSGNGLNFLWLSQDANLQTFSEAGFSEYGFSPAGSGFSPTGSYAGASFFTLGSWGSSTTSCSRSIQGKVFSGTDSTMHTAYVNTGGAFDVAARTFNARLTIVSQTGCLLHATLTNSGVPNTQHLIGVLETDGVTISFMEPKDGDGMDRDLIEARITDNGDGLDYFWLSQDANLQTVPANMGSHAGASFFALGSSTTSCMNMQGKVFSATNGTMHTGYVITPCNYMDCSAVSARTFSARLTIVSQTGCLLYATLENSGVSYTQHLMGVLDFDGPHTDDMTISFTEPKNQGRMNRDLIKATITDHGNILEFMWLSMDANLQTYTGSRSHAGASHLTLALETLTSTSSLATSCPSMQGKVFSATGSTMYTGYVTTGGASDVTARTFSATLTIVSQTDCLLYAILSNSGVNYTQHLIGVLETDGVTISFTEPKNQGRMDRGLIKATITNSGNGLDFLWLSQDANLQTVPTNTGSHAGASFFTLGSSTTSCASIQGKVFSSADRTMHTGYVTTGGAFGVAARTYNATLTIVSQTDCVLYATMTNSGVSHMQYMIGVLETDGVTISLTEPQNQGRMNRDFIKATIINSGDGLDYLWLSQDANLQTVPSNTVSHAGASRLNLGQSINYCPSMQGNVYTSSGSTMQTGYVTTGGDYDVTARTFSATLTIVNQTGCVLYATLTDSGVSHTQHLIGVLEADGVTISFTEPKNQGGMDRDLIKATITNSGNGLEYMWLSQDANLQTYSGSESHAGASRFSLMLTSSMPSSSTFNQDTSAACKSSVLIVIMFLFANVFAGQFCIV